MAISNFVVTLVGVGAIAYLMKADVRTSATMLRRNLKHIRTWLEEQGSSSTVMKEETKQIGKSTTEQGHVGKKKQDME